MNNYAKRDWYVRKIFSKAQQRRWDSNYNVCPNHGTYRWANSRAYCCEYWFRGVCLQKAFAQAFFGSHIQPRYRVMDNIVYVSLPEWEWQLMQMAIQKDLVEYLKQYL